LLSVLPFSFAASMSTPLKEKEWYEWRTYTIKFRGNLKLLQNYLTNALKPTMEKRGVNHFMVFRELGKSDPTKIHVIISYPNATVYQSCLSLQNDSTFSKAALDYTAITPDQAIFTRYSSSLLLAFDGLPQMLASVENASLYELRTYEGYSEDAVRRKIKMFNDEEFPLFHKVGLHPSFFGEMIAGPYRPALTYMLNFTDMEQRDANWKKFLQHPEWKAMLKKEEYANTVSNIRKIFLKPLK